MTTSDLTAVVHKEQIREALLRYCRGIDRCDRELVASAYHADAHDDHGRYRGPVEGFLDWVFDFLCGRYESHKHVVTNISIDLRGDRAEVETYFLAHQVEHPLEDGTQMIMTGSGRYLDQFELRGDEWRIARRRVVRDWSDRRPILPSPGYVPAGRRGPEDPSYRWEW